MNRYPLARSLLVDGSRGSFKPRLQALARACGPWAGFLALLAWGWRAYDLVHEIPAYWDALEVLWATQWYGNALRLHYSVAVYPLAFFPAGWQVATYAGGPTMFPALVPLYWLGGAALAYNVVTLLTFLLAFAGAFKLALRFVGRMPAAVAALLYTFWGFRWFRITGHMDIMIASAILPWMLWCLDRATTSPGRAWRWYVLAGLAWGISAASSFYFLFIGGLLALAYVLPRWLARPAGRRRAIAGLLLAVLLAAAVSGPALYSFWRASSASEASFYGLGEVNTLGASLNSLPIPSVWHPFLGSLARAVYSGPPTEQGEANFGTLAVLMALWGFAEARSRKAGALLAVPACLGVVLALGLTLKWNDVSVSWAALRPLDTLLWQAGHVLKPGLFVGQAPQAPFDTAVPLPGWLLVACVPFLDRARVFARYAFIAAPAVFVLAAFGLERVRIPGLRGLIALLLVLEVVPAPTESHPFPPPAHPAFTWLKAQNLEGGGIIDLYTPARYTMMMPISGETLYATLYSSQPTVAGTSSVLPASTKYLLDWLMAHPHAFQNPDFIPLLRFYDVRLIALHMEGGYDWQVLQEEAEHAAGVSLAGCFPPPAAPGPWNYPICILRLLPESDPSFNLLPREGWSGAESWGRWIEGAQARALWVAPTRTSYDLSVAAFPICVPGRAQSLALIANGATVAAQQWNGCDPWAAEIKIPAALVHVGENEIVLRASVVASPRDVTHGANPDPRQLSVGVTRLRIAASPSSS